MGNSHARRMLVECAWSYRFPVRQTMHLKRKAKDAAEDAKKIAWRAQKRLCSRYRKLVWCRCPVSGEEHNMVFWGNEYKQGGLKYRCPAAAYNLSCKGWAK